MTVPFKRALTLVVGVAALILAGCSGGDDAPPPADTGAEVAQDTQPAPDAPSGGSDVTGVALPSDFPAELPLPNGTLTAADKVGEGWNLLFEGVARDDVLGIISQLVDAGYEELLNSVAEDNVSATLSGEGRTVVLIWDGSGDSKALIYGITPEAS